MDNESKYLLYADDDQDDREALVDMISAVDQTLKMIAVDHGAALIDYLNGLEPAATLPCVIVLDVNMPVLNGFETLSYLKKQSQYAKVPVLMFTTSQSLSDTAAAGKADQFITKPVHLAELKKVAQQLAEFCRGLPILKKST